MRIKKIHNKISLSKNIRVDNILQLDEIVFKPMSYKELFISLERLLRFKNPFIKTDRVYREIIFKHLIFPKINLKKYSELPIGTILALVQNIWNTSVSLLTNCDSKDYDLNTYLAFEEIKEFKVKETLNKIIVSSNFQGLLQPGETTFEELISETPESFLRLIELFEHNGINYNKNYCGLNDFDNLTKLYFACKLAYPLQIQSFLALTQKDENITLNISRISWLNKLIKKYKLNLDNPSLKEKLEKIYLKAEDYRVEYSFQKPLKLIVLVEGITEELVLPVFADKSGINAHKFGIKIIACGGKNQVAKLYNRMKKETNLPIFIILDSDAFEIAEHIKQTIRKKDELFLIAEGEFEDILPDELICRAVNSYYALSGEIEKTDIIQSQRKTESLINIWKQKGFGDFRKVEFAQIISENILSTEDLSSQMLNIIENIKKMAN